MEIAEILGGIGFAIFVSIDILHINSLRRQDLDTNILAAIGELRGQRCKGGVGRLPGNLSSRCDYAGEVYVDGSVGIGQFVNRAGVRSGLRHRNWV